MTAVMLAFLIRRLTQPLDNRLAEWLDRRERERPPLSAEEKARKRAMARILLISIIVVVLLGLNGTFSS